LPWGNALFTFDHMMSRAPAWVLFLCFLLTLCGCYQISRNSLEEEKDPHFIEGQKRMNALDYDGAIKSFERALQTNPDNSAAHLELGALYENKKDLVSAIYHYQRFLQLNEHSSMAGVASTRMLGCKLKLASTVNYASVSSDIQDQILSLQRTNDFYEKKIDRLESELSVRPQYITNFVTNFVTVPQFSPRDRSAAHMTQPTQIVRTETEKAEEPEQPARTPVRHETETRARASTHHASTRRAAPKKKEEEPPKRANRPERTHLVRPGETLAIIAAKYGMSTKTLSAANPGTSHGVRAGQKLVIPNK
jgi:LysM repeat protein